MSLTFGMNVLGVGEHHASLVALEGDVDGDNEIGCQGVADGSVLDEGHEHLRYHDCFLTHDVELAAIDVDIAAGEVDVVAYIDEKIQIYAADGFVDHGAAFAGAVTRELCVNEIIRLDIATPEVSPPLMLNVGRSSSIRKWRNWSE